MSANTRTHPQLCDKNPLLLRAIPEQQFRSAEVAALLYQTGAAASYLFDSDDPEAAVRAVLDSRSHRYQLRLANDIVTSYLQYIGRLPITWDDRYYHRNDDVKLAVLNHMIGRVGYGVSLDLLDSFSKDFVGSVDEFCELIIATR